MGLPNELTDVMDAADRSGAAVVLLSENNEVRKVNDKYRSIYHFVDFNEKQTYESIFWRCVSQNLLEDRRAYVDPHLWLDSALRFRKTTSFAQYMIRHKDNRILMARHQIFPGVGTLTVRLDVSEKLSQSKLSSDDEKYSLDSLGSGLFALATSTQHETACALVSSSGVVVDANIKFLKLVERDDGLRLLSGRIVTNVKHETQKLYQAIAEKSQASASSDSTLTRISRTDFSGFYVASVTAPVSTTINEGCIMRGFANISIVDPDEEIRFRPESLKQIFDLTPAEARIAISLASGNDLGEIAVQNNVSLGTVRNQLKSVFMKMGISRQTDLVRILVNISRVVKL